MNPLLKEKLLLRKFSSIEYMNEMRNYMAQSIQGLNDALNYFAEHCQHIDLSDWCPADTPMAWEKRASPNFKGLLKSMDEGIENYKEGKISTIRGATGSMQGLSKDMDVLGERWWTCIPREVAYAHGVPLGKSCECAANIWRTVGHYWKQGSILKETVTGPIDESDLLKYLLPGESAE